MNTLSTPEEIYQFMSSHGGIFATWKDRPVHTMLEELEAAGRIRKGFESSRKDHVVRAG